jgi:hypothetical protein
MEHEQNDYEYYTRSSNNTMRNILIALLIIGAGGTILWLINRNQDLTYQNQRLYESGGSLYVPDPRQDLKVTLDVGSNLVGVPIIKGSVFNSSDRTTYKNIVVAVSYFTNNDELIGRENVAVTYTLSPGQIAEIRHKPEVKAYRRAALFRMELQEATVQ